MALMNDGAPCAAAHRAAPGGPAEDAWDVLEQLAREMPSCRQTAAQVRCVLEAVRRATGADLVYWLPGASGGPIQVAGDRPLPPGWCLELAQRQLLEAPEAGSRLCRPAQGMPAGPGGRAPRSVALIRVSRSRSIWMVAVSFDPGRPLRARDLKVMALARRLLLGQRQQARCQERLREALFGLARSLLAAIDAKDADTSGHSRRVARVAVRLGRQFGLGPAALGDLYLAALLHDVGKIGLRTSVLKNPGRLSAADMAHVREHPVIGDGIVAAVPSLAHLRPVVRHHHERYDGRGYPDGLAGLNIPLFARIVAVADACDAMTSDRPYRPALAAAEVDAVLVAGAGSQWDPEVVGHFLACRAELYPLFRQGPGDSVALAVEEVVRGWGEE